MDLTEQQRLSLWSHFRILAAAENDPTWWEFAEILRRGLEGEYYRLTESFSEELSERECGEVRDVLHMYHELQSSNRQLEPTRAVDQDRLRFPGFDPDDETGLVTYVSFIRENLGEYRDLEVDGHVGEAEGARLSDYRAMLETFGDGRADLTAAEIRKVLTAATGTAD